MVEKLFICSILAINPANGMHLLKQFLLSQWGFVLLFNILHHSKIDFLANMELVRRNHHAPTCGRAASFGLRMSNADKSSYISFVICSVWYMSMVIGLVELVCLVSSTRRSALWSSGVTPSGGSMLLSDVLYQTTRISPCTILTSRG